MYYDEVLEKDYYWDDDQPFTTKHKVPLIARNPMTHKKRGRKFKPPSGYLRERKLSEKIPKKQMVKEPKMNREYLKKSITNPVPKIEQRIRYWERSKTGSRNLLGGSGEYWNKIAEQSEAKFKSKIQPLPDYDTTFDGWRER